MYRLFFQKRILLILFFVFVFPQVTFAIDPISQQLIISASVVQSSFGASGSLIMPTKINFSGIAYPFSRVFILKNGYIATTTIADQLANFSATLSGLYANTYTFSVYTEDINGKKSDFFSFPIFITNGTTVNIDNIFLSPTININKTEIKKGDKLSVFGQGAPKGNVIISVLSGLEYLYKVDTNNNGLYFYNLDTSVLNLGKYYIKSKSVLGDKSSSFNFPLSFIIGEKTKIKQEDKCFFAIKGDVNCDYLINLVDFSIIAYWYKKDNPPNVVDLNKDGIVTLSDFSIMASNWTG